MPVRAPREDRKKLRRFDFLFMFNEVVALKIYRISKKGRVKGWGVGESPLLSGKSIMPLDMWEPVEGQIPSNIAPLDLKHLKRFIRAASLTTGQKTVLFIHAVDQDDYAVLEHFNISVFNAENGFRPFVINHPDRSFFQGGYDGCVIGEDLELPVDSGHLNGFNGSVVQFLFRCEDNQIHMVAA